MKTTKKLLMAFAIGGIFATFSCNTSNAEVVSEKEEVSSEVKQATKTEQVNEEKKALNVVAVAMANPNFSTLVAAVKAADLVETLSGEGPFTVFAPTNAAFNALPEGTVETLLKPENKAMLSSILTYHVVSGKFNAATVVKAINENNGSFEITTVQGEKLVASLDGPKVMLKDAKGNMSQVVIPDVAASNGVIHAINTVVMPK